MEPGSKKKDDYRGGGNIYLNLILKIVHRLEMYYQAANGL